MSTSVPSDSKPVQQPVDAAQAASTYSPEESFRRVWAKNSKFVYLLCAAALLVILGKGGYEFFKEQRDKSVQADYAAATSNDKLKAFSASHAGHPLAGVASLRLADDAYTEGRFADAAAAYQRASESLTAPLDGRARIGFAIAKINAGQADEGEAKLKQLADDQTQMKAVRAEAAYHLATLAVGSNRPEMAVKYIDVIDNVEPGSLWARQAMALRASLPAQAADSAVKVPAKP